MIKETSIVGTANLFTNAENYLQASTKKQCTDETAWFNQFRVRITNKINEKIFFPLYCDNNGAPISSIRINVAMLILKDSKGWSYVELREQCMANIFVRRALGLYNLDDPIPARSTFFDFLSRLSKWKENTNEDLLDKLFKEITKEQMLEFSVMGNKIRMDSTTLGSNIAWLSRYELVHETIRYAYSHSRSRSRALINSVLSEEDINVIKEIRSETGDKVSYRSTNPQLKSKLIRLGTLMHNIIRNIQATSTKQIEVLRKVFFEQYEIVDGKVVLLPVSRLLPTNIQSPYDIEGDYHRKNKKKVKGYTVNPTETCHPDNAFDLITDVIVAPATVHDSKHLIPAVEATEEVTGQKVETINTDSNYHSQDNQEECAERGIDLVLSGLGGGKPKYDIELLENGELSVTNLITQETTIAIKINRKDPAAPPAWKIINENGNETRFEQKKLDTCNLRRMIKNRSKEEINLRNNVEATISQLMYPFSNDKSVYRGLIRHVIWARARCMGINCCRITRYMLILKELFKSYVQILVILCKMRVLTSFLFNIFNIFTRLMTIFWKFWFKNIFWSVFFPKKQNICINVSL